MENASPKIDHTPTFDGSRLIRLAQERASKNGKAFDITVELTHRCNVACRHCYIIPGEEEMPISEWERILAELAGHGVFVLTVTGGEPTLYPRFSDFISLTRRLSFAIRLFSNLTTLLEKDIDLLSEANVLGIETTIHAADAETHDRFCRSPGAFERTLRTLRLLQQKGLPVSIKTGWNRYNHKSPERMFRLAEELKLPLRTSPSMTPRRDMTTDHFDCRLSEDELFEVFMELIRLGGDPSKFASCDSYPLPGGDFRFCGAGVSSVRVGPSGKVHPCIEMQEIIGDLRRQSFEEVWCESPFLKNLRSLRVRDATQCMACRDLRFCFRCPGQAYNEGAGLCGPSREACSIARVNRRVFEALGGKDPQGILETSRRIEPK